MKIYYAHCLVIYNTPQEKRDIELLTKLFPEYEIYNPNNEECQKGAEKESIFFFEKLVKDCDLLVFRGLPNGMIPSGVYKEIRWAQEKDIPIIELPCFTGREMSLDDTRLFLKEIGQR